MRLVAALMIVLASTGCGRFIWQRVTADEPIDEARTVDLRPGIDDLGKCLATLGAPNRVWETGRGDIAMSYSWSYEEGLNFSISYSFERFLGISLSIDDDRIRRRGVVLLFDDALKLKELRRGLIGEIAPTARRRPGAIDSD